MATKTYFYLGHDVVDDEAGWLHARRKFLECVQELLDDKLTKCRE